MTLTIQNYCLETDSNVQPMKVFPDMEKTKAEAEGER